MPVLKSVCPLDCPDACSLDVTVEAGRVVKLDGGRDNPITRGYICAKVRHFDAHLYSEERLSYPALRSGPRGSGAFRRVSWDEALDTVARRLVAVRDGRGGEAVLPFSYGGSNGLLTQDTVDARLWRRLGASRLARTVCAAPTGRAASGLYGKMPGVAYPDYLAAQMIVVWGANPAASGIHLMPFLQDAQDAGATLVVVDPRRTRLARRADVHLPLRPGTDLPVALSLIRWFFATGRADRAFLDSHATGADELERRAAAWTFERAASVAGVTAAELEAFAERYAAASPAVIRCGWGLERNRNGGSAVASVLALPAVAGKFRVRGGGYTMSNSGAWNLSSAVAAGEGQPPTREINMNRLGRALEERGDAQVDLLFVYNCNPLATMPDQERVRRGLLREDLFTVVFEQVMTDTARLADVLLPATTFLEHSELSRGYGAMVLHASSPVIPPVGEARSNTDVFGELCRRTGVARPGDLEDDAAIARAILDASGSGDALRDAMAKDGVAYPETGPAPIQFVDHFPRTPDRKIRLVPPDLDREAPLGLYGYAEDPGGPEAPLALISPASEKTISSTFGQLLKHPAVLEMNPVDAATRGITDGDTVAARNELGEVVCAVRVTEAIRPGVVSLPKGLWLRHTRNGATSNALSPDTLTDLGGGACFNDARVQVSRVD